MSGNLLPSSCDAGGADSVASAPSLGGTCLWGQCPGQCLHVPQQEPSLGVIPAAHPALLHSHVSSKVSLTLSLASVPDGCLQEGFYGNQGQEKPAHQVQCSNVRDRRAGRGVIPSKVGARAWWREQGRVFHLLHKERLTEHSPAPFPSTVVNSIFMGFFSDTCLTPWPAPPQQVVSAVVVHAMKVNSGWGESAHKLKALRLDSEHRQWQAWQTYHVVTAFLIKAIGKRVNWAERKQGRRTPCRLRNSHGCKAVKKASKCIHSNVEKEVSNVSQFTYLKCMLCVFPCNMSMQILILSLLGCLQLLREELVLREQMGLECREEHTKIYRTHGPATDHPVDNTTSQKQKLNFIFLFVCDSFCHKH